MDQLGIGQRAHRGIPGAQATRKVGFDEQTIHAMDTAPVARGPNLQRFGPFPIYTTPADVSRGQVERIAVNGNPRGQFSAAAFWQLIFGSGGAQEIVNASELTAGNAALLTEPARVPGTRYVNYGCLDEPQPLYVEMPQNGTLNIVVFTTLSFDRPATLYVRVAGTIFFARG